MRTVRLPSGEAVPALGQGTWHMGERDASRADEVRALQAGLDLGLTLIDTAEMYADGGAEEVVGEAIAGRREEVFLVSKVYPHNASRDGVVAACERSLRRLGTDRIDLYLLHWVGGEPLAETVAGFERLVADGKIRGFGVSNFGTDDMARLWATPGGDAAWTNQVLYNPTRRGIEFDLLPWCRARGLPIMAYSPLEQGRLRPLAAAARECGTDAATLSLAWVLRHPDVVAIPKAARVAHVEANRRALDLSLSADDLARIDRLLPPPTRARPLDIL